MRTAAVVLAVLCSVAIGAETQPKTPGIADVMNALPASLLPAKGENQLRRGDRSDWVRDNTAGKPVVVKGKITAITAKSDTGETTGYRIVIQTTGVKFWGGTFQGAVSTILPVELREKLTAMKDGQEITLTGTTKRIRIEQVTYGPPMSGYFVVELDDGAIGR